MSDPQDFTLTVIGRVGGPNGEARVAELTARAHALIAELAHLDGVHSAVMENPHQGRIDLLTSNPDGTPRARAGSPPRSTEQATRSAQQISDDAARRAEPAMDDVPGPDEDLGLRESGDQGAGEREALVPHREVRDDEAAGLEPHREDLEDAAVR